MTVVWADDGGQEGRPAWRKKVIKDMSLKIILSWLLPVSPFFYILAHFDMDRLPHHVLPVMIDTSETTSLNNFFPALSLWFLNCCYSQ